MLLRGEAPVIWLDNCKSDYKCECAIGFSSPGE
jgi:hypothetical protein